MTTLHKAAREALEACETALRQFTKTPSTLADSTARGNAHAALANLRAALSEAPGEEREGWVLVPVEPTPEMVVAAAGAVRPGGYLEDIYSAMLAARPSAPMVEPGTDPYAPDPQRRMPPGRYVIKRNDDGEFGATTGWLYRQEGPPCIVSGRPVYVWRPLTDLIGHTPAPTGALTEEQVDAVVYAVCPDFDAAHEGPSIDDVRAIARAAIAKFCEVNGLAQPNEAGKEGGA